MRDPEGVLGAIVARKRSDVAARLGSVTVAELAARAEPSRRCLASALRGRGARFIMEVKRASPSAGPLAAQVDPARQALAYAGAADAVSVLTDGPFFGGSLADLAEVRRVFGGPVLAKDFIVDPRQLVEARLHGADAVLAMLSVLDDAEAVRLLRLARRFGMDVLVEAHDAEEASRAVRLGAELIGVNNRDLRTLEVDLANTERLARLVPTDRILVSESGIGCRADVDRLAPLADAFLVGSSLMRAPDPALAARALAFGRVKVCGITDAIDAEAAAMHGATWVGMVMVPQTPRAVSIGDARDVADAARRAGALTAGVFRNAPVRDVARAAASLKLDAVQLHGAEDEAYIARLRALLPRVTEIWAAGPVGHETPAPRPGADRMLFDTEVGGRAGGTGLPFDWSRIARRPELRRAFLAGGLNPANAAAAARVGAFALDVGSGVEMAPRRKDAGRMRAFFDALRPVDRGERAPC